MSLAAEVEQALWEWIRSRPERLHCQYEGQPRKATLSINRGLEVVVIHLETLEPPPGLKLVVERVDG